MKRITFQFLTGIFILLFTAYSCTKDEQPSVAFAMKAADNKNPVQSSNPADKPGSFTQNMSFEWNTAWIYITDFVFDAEYYGFTGLLDTNKYHNYHYEWSGNQKIDLLSEPKIFADMELPQGVYSHFELSMTSARFGYTDGPNFYLAGTYGPVFGGTPIAVSVTEKFDMMMTYDTGESINTDKGDMFNSMVELSLDHVFDGITAEQMSSAERTDGWILISKDHNIDLYAKILENLRGRDAQKVNWEIHRIQ